MGIFRMNEKLSSLILDARLDANDGLIRYVID